MIIHPARIKDHGIFARAGLRPLLAALDTDGEEARIVGGAVRNALLERPITDVDLATTALPDEVERRAKQAGWKVIPTGLAHGTLTIVVAGHGFEVTTLRADVTTDGRRASVAFTRDFAVDAMRRDFTINALFANLNGDVFDFTNGIADAEARRVRFIGDADLRIAEDYLRILRFARFTADYGAGALDRGGLEACIRGRKGIGILSAERIGSELRKILVSPGVLQVLPDFSAAGILELCLGGACDAQRFAKLVALEKAHDLAPEPMRRLAALTLTKPGDVLRITESLRLTRAESDALHQLAKPPPSGSLEARLYSEGRQTTLSRQLLAMADGMRLAEPDTVFATIAAWQKPILPFSSRDFLKRGLEPGPALGAAMRKAEADWVEAGFPADPAVVSRLLDKAV